MGSWTIDMTVSEGQKVTVPQALPPTVGREWESALGLSCMAARPAEQGLCRGSWAAGHFTNVTCDNGDVVGYLQWAIHKGGPT